MRKADDASIIMLRSPLIREAICWFYHIKNVQHKEQIVQIIYFIYYPKEGADIYYIDYLAQHDEGHRYKIISKLVFKDPLGVLFLFII